MSNYLLIIEKNNNNIHENKEVKRVIPIESINYFIYLSFYRNIPNN